MRDFEPVEGQMEVVTDFPSDIFEKIKREAADEGLTVTAILKRDLALLTNYCNFVSGDPTAADDHNEGRLYDLIGREKPLVDIAFHEHKREAPGATKRSRLIMPYTVVIDLDASALGLGLESTADFVLYAAFLGRHIKRHLFYPPPEERP